MTNKASHVYKHLQSSGTCRDPCSAESFTILDFAASSFQVRVKEALYIRWEIPTLNQQLRHLHLSLPQFFFMFYHFILFNFLIPCQQLLASAQPLLPEYDDQIVNVNFMV